MSTAIDLDSITIQHARAVQVMAEKIRAAAWKRYDEANEARRKARADAAAAAAYAAAAAAAWRSAYAAAWLREISPGVTLLDSVFDVFDRAIRAA
jgi:hypothetical protein